MRVESGNDDNLSSNDAPVEDISDEISFSGYTHKCCISFVDIVDSTEIIAQISDAARIRKYYSTFINTIAAIAKRFSANVIKNTGDCLIYYFPKTLEYSNTNAFRDVVECGLAMIEASSSVNSGLNKDRLPNINYRVSADFGSVETARSISSRSYDMLGPTLSLCAKMNSLAPPNGMVIGSNLYRIVTEFYFGYYNFQELNGSYIIDNKEKYSVYAVKSRNRNVYNSFHHGELSKLDLNGRNFSSVNNKKKSLCINQKQGTRHPCNILIVDDEPDALLTYKTFLACEDFNVDAFTVPEEALRTFATKNPSYYSLVIVDIRMPRLNGLQFYKRLKAISISAKVLFISALDAAAELVSILSDASDMRVIKKPADQEHFMAAVNALLRSPDE